MRKKGYSPEEEIFIIGSPYRLRGSECSLRNEAFSQVVSHVGRYGRANNPTEFPLEGPIHRGITSRSQGGVRSSCIRTCCIDAFDHYLINSKSLRISDRSQIKISVHRPTYSFFLLQPSNGYTNGVKPVSCSRASQGNPIKNEQS